MNCSGLILAAGRGARLGTLTESSPKCMVHLCGRPLIAWQAAALRRAGITDITAVLGYCADRVATVPNRLINERWQETNMVRSLFAVGPTISTTVIVSYSDIVYSPHAVSELISSSHALAVTYDVNWRELWTARFADPTSDAEEFRIDGAGCILEIGARVSSISTVQGQFMGLLRIEPNMWKQLWATVDAMAPAEADRLDTTSLLRLAIQRGMKVHGIAYNEPWAEVDTLADLRLYEEDSRFHKLRTMLDSLHEDRLTSSDAAGGAAGQEEN